MKRMKKSIRKVQKYISSYLFEDFKNISFFLGNRTWSYLLVWFTAEIYENSQQIYWFNEKSKVK